MAERKAQTIHIAGAVQGVGFRPFVWRLARDEGIRGSVANTAQGVIIHAEADTATLKRFIRRLQQEAPPLARIDRFETTPADIQQATEFRIIESSSGAADTLILPDLALCDDCLRELYDPNDRRYRYPFITCTNCGPRFSIIESLPYDRPNTTIKHFPLCPACEEEYRSPGDRRFHAQPLACPECGPHVELWDANGKIIATQDRALHEAVFELSEGEVVAVKGLGGFHLMVNAFHEGAIARLRQRKHREEKPFAVMAPDIAWACSIAAIMVDEEEALLTGPVSPIVLLPKAREAFFPIEVAPNVAPGNPYLGVMLPCTPLHHLLLRELDLPVVATSGNLSDEPICIDEHEALERLRGIADLFLVHNRPIARHVDDSIVRVVAGRTQILRRARGYAPLPVRLKEPVPHILGVGAHLKNSTALAVGDNVFISQHIGDLETTQAHHAFREVITSLRGLYHRRLEGVACDLHPDYLSTQHAGRIAEEEAAPLTRVQHHEAHVLACLADNHMDGPALGVAWDGLGLGDDSTIWGGEFFLVEPAYRCKRVASLRPFPLPGGDKANQEPRRAALGILYEIYGEAAFRHTELASLQAFEAEALRSLKTMLTGDVNCPRTSSMGRLFDAVASLLDLRQVLGYEGQAAMQLEWAVKWDAKWTPYPVSFHEDETGLLRLDWQPMIEGIFDDIAGDVATDLISTSFHRSLIESLVELAQHFRQKTVALSGGCFQNRYLLETAVAILRDEGFDPVWHRDVPPNDGGVALGQVIAAARK